jgi:hypothetical protein
MNDQLQQDPNRTNSKIRRNVDKKSIRKRRKSSRSTSNTNKDDEADDEGDEELEDSEEDVDLEEEDDDEDEEEELELEFDQQDYHKSKKHKSEHSPPLSPSIHPIQQVPRQSTIEGFAVQQNNHEAEEEDSEGEHSDYHEEMLKGDVEEFNIPMTAAQRRFSRRQSAIIAAAHQVAKKSTSANKSAAAAAAAVAEAAAAATTSSTNNKSNSIHTNTPTTTSNNISSTTTTSSIVATNTHPHETTSSPTSLSVKEKEAEGTTSKSSTVPQSSSADKPASNTSTTASTTTAHLAPPANIRKPSFSFSSGFPGDQELWTPFSFEHDFDNVFLQEASIAHHIPFNIATPESVSVSELDNYFASTSNSSSRSQRKSFSSAMLGPNDKSLLQKVLLASAARGVADKIDEEEEEEEQDVEKQLAKEEGDKKEEKLKEKEVVVPVKEEPAPVKTSFSSSSLMDVDNGEDFVKFEDDEKKDPPATVSTIATAPVLPQPQIQPQQAVAATTSSPSPAAAAPAQTSSPAPAVKKMADILPATTPTTSTNPTPTLSAAEILKSMNIQNLNLSALHQMTSNIPSLQHLSPTFDLAKTMAAYMQSLAKSANANASSSSSSNSPHAMDLKSILTRFPALEAFIKKDPVVSITPPTNTAAAGSPAPPPSLSIQTQLQPPPPLVSPNPDFVPSLISGSLSPTEPIVHTLTTTTPPMYITVIDHIAVCIVVLAKTEHTPEYCIMRRVDTGFINGTVLLTAGGIETESERSMILSFEMERVRMPKKKSLLFGTWIPLRRAQELAVTCSIQHKLGHFLEDSIESYFPNPLPIQVNTRKPHRDNRLTALALAALRSENFKANGFAVPPISRQSSSSGSMGAAQLQELLLTHPHKALKSNGLNKAPLLGRYNDDDNATTEPQQLKQQSAASTKSSASSVTNSTNSSISGKEEGSDVDIVNSSDSSVAATSSNEEEDSENESDTMGVTHDNKSMNLEEMLSRVTNTNTNKQPLHIHPRDLQKKRRRSSIMKAEEEELEPTKVAKISSQTIVRKKPTSSTGGGKWSSSSGSSSNGKSTTAASSASAANKKSSTIIIKKSASSGGGKKNSATVKKATAAREEEEHIDNVVVEHKPIKIETKVETPVVKSPPKPSAAAVTTITKKTTEKEEATATAVEEEEHVDEDDEDEDIDIGGSDFDDDLR